MAPVMFFGIKRLIRGRSHAGQRLRPELERLEGRALLTGSPPFGVGGDPIVNPADFRITTFASGLNYPHAMTTLSDGSLLVGLSNPLPGFTDYFDTTGQLLRLVDANGDGAADDAGTVLYDGLPGEITALHQAGPYFLATSSLAGSERISFLHAGATPSDSLTLAGSINFAFPAGWEHTTFASAVQPTPGRKGSYTVYFNIGSQYNGVVIGDDGSVVLDASGNPIYQPTTDTVGASGLATGTLQGDSIYAVIVRDNHGTPSVSNPVQIAKGLRNAASMEVDPATGRLLFADNGIDGNDFGNEAWSTDELNSIAPSAVGGQFNNFGFPYNYTKTVDAPGDPVVVVNPGLGRPPLIAFEPLPDPVLTVEGSESEGPSGFAIAPTMFPPGLNQGVFIGFHGLFNEGGTTNDENPLVFADPKTGHYFDFISNNEPNIGHLDEALATSDSLFLADLSSTGDVFGAGGPGQGVIYQIQAINKQPQIAQIASQTVQAGQKLSVIVHATDPNPGQSLTFTLGPGAPSGAAIDPNSGNFTWIATGSSPKITVTVVATDNGSPKLSASRSISITVRNPPAQALVNQRITAIDPAATGLIGITILADAGASEPANIDIAAFYSVIRSGRLPSTRFRPHP
jgi:hypothetical protein